MVVAGRSGAVEARLVVLGQPVREELLDCVGLDDSAGQDVGADLAGLFQEQDTEIFIAGFVGELFEADGGGETCWACGQEITWLDGLGLDDKVGHGTRFQDIKILGAHLRLLYTHRPDRSPFLSWLGRRSHLGWPFVVIH